MANLLAKAPRLGVSVDCTYDVVQEPIAIKAEGAKSNHISEKFRKDFRTLFERID